MKNAPGNQYATIPWMIGWPAFMLSFLNAIFATFQVVKYSMGHELMAWLVVALAWSTTAIFFVCSDVPPLRQLDPLRVVLDGLPLWVRMVALAIFGVSGVVLVALLVT